MAEPAYKPHHEELPYWGHSVRIREFHDRVRLDMEKMAAELSRLLISNLLLLNAGGLGSIPAISLFLGTQNLSAGTKIALFWRPGLAFGIGAVCALLSAFMAYLNYSAAAEEAKQFSRAEVATLFKFHPAYTSGEEYRRVNDAEQAGGMTRAFRMGVLLRRFALIAIGLGFASLFAFVTGLILLLLSAGSVPPTFAGGD